MTDPVVPGRFSTVLSWIVFPLVALGCVGCDQVSKGLARELLAARPPIVWLCGAVRLQYTENAGAFLSWGSSWPASVRFWVFTVMTTVALLALVLGARLHPVLSQMNRLGMALLIGGAAGNLCDRIANQGMVVDFLNFGWGQLRTGIFNLADVAIVIGAGVLLLAHVRPVPGSTR